MLKNCYLHLNLGRPLKRSVFALDRQLFACVQVDGYEHGSEGALANHFDEGEPLANFRTFQSLH
jgi:hypothetical protein